MIRSLRKARSVPALRQIHTSGPAPQPSYLLSNIQREYSALNMPSLKNECRARGLRVSGRKAELIDRLSAHEASRRFSTTKRAPAKGDDSHIDYFNLPAERPKQEKVKITIPAPPFARGSAHTVERSKVNLPEADTGATPLTVHTVSDAEVSTMNTDLGDGAKSDEQSGSQSGNLSGRDKTFLAALGASVVAWWSAKSLSKKND